MCCRCHRSPSYDWHTEQSIYHMYLCMDRSMHKSTLCFPRQKFSQSWWPMYTVSQETENDNCCSLSVRFQSLTENPVKDDIANKNHAHFIGTFVTSWCWYWQAVVEHGGESPTAVWPMELNTAAAVESDKCSCSCASSKRRYRCFCFLFIFNAALLISYPPYIQLAISEMWCWSGGRGILIKLTLCYSIVYYYNGAQRYEQFLQVGWLYRALILLGLALCLPSTSSSTVFVVLYIHIKNFFAYILLFTFYWAEPGGIGPWPGWLTIIRKCYDAVVWVIWPNHLRNEIMCRVGC